ncbi:MAG: hypothetical protein IMY74_04620 [Bacteroidetes bacterium]|nr:hypothetical protein [Bacteroidota bacterium]MCK5764796.1 hypothetical protein [Bacteroidales bacterium]
MFYFRSIVKKMVTEIIKRSFAWLLIISMGMLIANKAVFFHEHILPDGTVIAHAHPYDKSADPEPYKTHHHSEAELFSFCQADKLFFFGIVILAIFSALSRSILPVFIQKAFTPVTISGYNGRAPPFL